jgi:hypothetical protein
LTPQGFTIQNVSISGTDTATSLGRFDQDVTPYRPAFVMLATSIVNEPPATAVESYLQGTLSLIAKVEAIGAIPIIVGPYPNDGFVSAMYAGIKGIYTTLGAEGVPILDFLDGADDGQGHWVAGLSADGTHPTDVGHALLFDCIPLTLFDALQLPVPPVNPHGFGSWVQNTDMVTEGDLAIQPSSGMGSWTISFWTNPSLAPTERALLTVNGGALQLRRTGTAWTLWSSGKNLAIAELRGASAFHHVALTYQSITGTLSWYLDGQLRTQAVIPGLPPVAAWSLGGDPGNAGWNAGEDSFADAILYRAPLAQADIQAIRTGQAPWKSVEAWLPLAYSPDESRQNLAASIVTVLAHGAWSWSNAGISSVPPAAPRLVVKPAAPPNSRQIGAGPVIGDFRALWPCSLIR